MNGAAITNGGSWLEPASLEELEQRIVSALENERTAAWDIGDALNATLADSARRAPNAQAAEEAEERLFGYLASRTGCTTAKLKQHRTLSRVFEPGMRDLTRSWVWHRSLRNAAIRTQTALAEMLKLATDNGWGAEDLCAYKAGSVERVSFKGTCGECGYQMRLTCRKPGIRQHVGHKVLCGFCAEPVGTLS